MTTFQREKAINRIISGKICFKIRHNGNPILLFYKGPTSYQRCLADSYYEDYLEEYELTGLHTEHEYLRFLLEKRLWSNEEETRLNKLKKEIEEKKVELYEKYISSISRGKVKLELDALKKDFEFLYSKKNVEIHKSASGLAGIAKIRYLIGVSLYLNDTPLFNENSFWDMKDCDLLDKVVNLYNESQFSDTDYRELCRNEPWRSYWMCRKACGGQVFKCSSSEMTDEQRSLVYWTLLYDNVYENPDCPSDDVIEDDDALDGFLISQNKKKRDGSVKNELEGKLSDKIKNADEIFIPVTIADREKIESLNSELALATKAVREKAIKEKGALPMAELPDVKLDLSMQSVTMYGEKMKGKT